MPLNFLLPFPAPGGRELRSRDVNVILDPTSRDLSCRGVSVTYSLGLRIIPAPVSRELSSRGDGGMAEPLATYGRRRGGSLGFVSPVAYQNKAGQSERLDLLQSFFVDQMDPSRLTVSRGHNTPRGNILTCENIASSFRLI